MTSAEKKFWKEAFLAALPEAFNATGWVSGKKPITGRSERVCLAAHVADDALTEARNRGAV